MEYPIYNSNDTPFIFKNENYELRFSHEKYYGRFCSKLQTYKEKTASIIEQKFKISGVDIEDLAIIGLYRIVEKNIFFIKRKGVLLSWRAIENSAKSKTLKFVQL